MGFHKRGDEESCVQEDSCGKTILAHWSASVCQLETEIERELESHDDWVATLVESPETLPQAKWPAWWRHGMPPFAERGPLPDDAEAVAAVEPAKSKRAYHQPSRDLWLWVVDYALLRHLQGWDRSGTENILDDLKSSCSVGGIPMPDFEVLDARIASALNRISLILASRERSVWRNNKSQKRGPKGQTLRFSLPLRTLLTSMRMTFLESHDGTAISRADWRHLRKKSGGKLTWRESSFLVMLFLIHIVTKRRFVVLTYAPFGTIAFYGSFRRLYLHQ